MTRRLLTLGAIGLALIAVASQFSPTDPTEADLKAIRRVVGRRTMLAVGSIDPQASGAVKVWARGWREASETECFVLRKVGGFWWVCSKQHWTSEPVERGIPEAPTDPTVRSR